MASLYWQYFVAVEADFDRSTRYVELHRDNFTAYSVEFARLILAACSEVDVVCKMLCEKIASSSNPENINEYRDIIHLRYPGFHKLEVQVPRYGLSIVPWQEWCTGTNPSWWRSYNKVKHERHHHFSSANLENALNAVAGLFVAVLYQYPDELRANIPATMAKLANLGPELEFAVEDRSPAWLRAARFHHVSIELLLGEVRPNHPDEKIRVRG